jgi:hypothetical protein
MHHGQRGGWATGSLAQARQGVGSGHAHAKLGQMLCMHCLLIAAVHVVASRPCVLLHRRAFAATGQVCCLDGTNKVMVVPPLSETVHWVCQQLFINVCVVLGRARLASHACSVCMCCQRVVPVRYSWPPLLSALQPVVVRGRHAGVLLALRGGRGGMEQDGWQHFVRMSLLCPGKVGDSAALAAACQCNEGSTLSLFFHLGSIACARETAHTSGGIACAREWSHTGGTWKKVFRHHGWSLLSVFIQVKLCYIMVRK